MRHAMQSLSKLVSLPCPACGPLPELCRNFCCTEILPSSRDHAPRDLCSFHGTPGAHHRQGQALPSPSFGCCAPDAQLRCMQYFSTRLGSLGPATSIGSSSGGTGGERACFACSRSRFPDTLPARIGFGVWPDTGRPYTQLPHGCQPQLRLNKRHEHGAPPSRSPGSGTLTGTHTHYALPSFPQALQFH